MYGCQIGTNYPILGPNRTQAYSIAFSDCPMPLHPRSCFQGTTLLSCLPCGLVFSLAADVLRGRERVAVPYTFRCGQESQVGRQQGVGHQTLWAAANCNWSHHFRFAKPMRLANCSSSKPPLMFRRRCSKTEASTCCICARHSLLLLTLRSCGGGRSVATLTA
jgi:hypothetical protein